MDEIAATLHAATADPAGVQGLASTFEAFVDAETARFHGALRLLTRDRGEAEDLMQLPRPSSDGSPKPGSASSTSCTTSGLGNLRLTTDADETAQVDREVSRPRSAT